ncbi:MAG: nuclear transport factor 2 family protein [Nitrospinae bacterium]|nr:nuclear transport factor 2 family protein [Nitrospinota bacterium]
MLNEKLALEANERFYKAFNEQNLELMKEVWHDDLSILCIHPGWHAIHGFEPVIQSWKDIFENTQDDLEIRLDNVEIIASMDLAWVSCEEKLFSFTMSGVKTSNVQATNVFRLVEGGWKMALHHASAVPHPSEEEEPSLN